MRKLRMEKERHQYIDVMRPATPQRAAGKKPKAKYSIQNQEKIQQKTEKGRKERSNSEGEGNEHRYGDINTWTLFVVLVFNMQYYQY